MSFLSKHKLLVGAIILIVAAGGYYRYRVTASNKNTVRYVTDTAQKGTLIASVNGSGQVSVTNQIDVKPKISGTVTEIVPDNGQSVAASTLLASLDAQDAQKAVRDAQVSLESAKLALDKLRKPATDYELIQAQNAVDSAKTTLDKLMVTQQVNVQNAQDTKQKAQDALSKGYDDAYTTIADTFADLPDTLTDLATTINSDGISKSEPSVGSQSNDAVFTNTINYHDSDDRDTMTRFVAAAVDAYNAAKTAYDSNLLLYKNTNRTASQDATKHLLDQTIATTQTMTDAIKSEVNMINFWVDYRNTHRLPVFATVTQYQTNLNADTTKTNKHLSDLQTIDHTIDDNNKSIDSANRDLDQMSKNNPLDMAAAQALVKEKQSALVNLKAGADPLDIQSQQLTVKERENALLDARSKLADYAVRAPFTGVLAKVNVKVGDPVSSNTVVATLITTQKIAQIALNEVDIAKVKLGQKATLTFDAIPGLSITGEVAKMDTLGTTSQGVVTYTVEIGFDTQDTRVKPGMSVSASIITDIKQDVITVPNAAVKQQGNGAYVELPASNNGAPARRAVVTGLSNDSMTEIISGLSVGDTIITQTISSSSSSGQQTNSGIRIPGLTGGGGGGFRGGGGRGD